MNKNNMNKTNTKINMNKTNTKINMNKTNTKINMNKNNMNKKLISNILMIAMIIMLFTSCSKLDAGQLISDLIEQSVQDMNQNTQGSGQNDVTNADDSFNNVSADTGLADTAPHGTNETSLEVAPPVTLPSASREELEAKEVFANDYERKAAEIIDDSIWKALDAVALTDYSGLDSGIVESDYSEPYKDVCERYDRMLTSGYRDFFEMAYTAGTSYDYFYVKQSEYGDSLGMDSLNTMNVLLLYDFRLQCYFNVADAGWDSYSEYFDPESDANAEVKYDSPEFDAMKEKMAVYDAVIRRIVSKMPSELSTFKKYQYLAAVISYQCHYTEPNEERRNKQTSYAALVNGSAVCEGYSKAMIELCKAADLACEYVSGRVLSNGEGHMWNLITLEDGSYYVDITWCDGLCEPDDPDWFEYFGRTEAELEEIDHLRNEGNAATGSSLR